MDSKNNIYDGKLFSYHLLEIDETDSTNSELERIIENTCLTNGTILRSNFQTDGKGMMSNEWKSKKNENLLFSLLLYPDFLKASDQFYLSKCLSLGICSGLKKALPKADCQIKWPNDVLIDGKKISGTLIKSALRGDDIQYSILGSGINVNQLDFPIDLNATSLKLLLGKSFDINELLLSIIYHFNLYYEQLQQERKNKINEAYLNNLLGYQSWQSYKSEQHGSITGQIQSILEDGRMMLKDSNGKSHCFDIKEISLILA